MNMVNLNRYKKELLYVLALIALSVLFVFPSPSPLQTKTEAEITAPEHIFPVVSLSAEAAIVKDLKTGEVLYAKNKNEEHPLASLTKIMSTVVAYEFLGNTSVITVNESDLLAEGDTGLFRNELWESKELLGLTLLASSNDGSSAIKSTVESSFQVDLIKEMNKKVESLGLLNTYFLNESGLDITKNIGGSYGSAEDVATLLGYALEKQYDLFEITKNKSTVISSLNFGPHLIQNTNILTDSIPSLLLGKTGFTDLAGGNLAIIFEKEPQHPIAIVVLGSTKEARFTDVETLVWATFRY